MGDERLRPQERCGVAVKKLAEHGGERRVRRRAMLRPATPRRQSSAPAAMAASANRVLPTPASPTSSNRPPSPSLVREKTCASSSSSPSRPSTGSFLLIPRESRGAGRRRLPPAPPGSAALAPGHVDVRRAGSSLPEPARPARPKRSCLPSRESARPRLAAAVLTPGPEVDRRRPCVIGACALRPRCPGRRASRCGWS